MKKTVFWFVVFSFAASIGFAQSFPENFQGTWKRPQYASTLTFTGNTVKASNRDVVWTLRSVSGNRWTIVSSGTAAVLALTVRLVNGKLEISGDSGAGESNWNGTWTNIKPAIPTVSFNSQGGSAVASQTVTKGGTVPYPEEPVKARVYFDGWYKEVRCINPCDYGAPVSGALTLYALWRSESEMIATEFGEGVPEIFEVNNAAAAAEGQPGWNTSWAKARAAINSGGSGRNYVIKVTGNFQAAGVSSSTFTPRNIKVLVYAPVNKTIFLSGKGNLFYTGANQSLILRNITLQGTKDNDKSMIYSGGANARLVLRPGTVIRDNEDSAYGGGVYVDGGTFTMSGGAISGNSASSNGGGVYVKSGSFTMSGGAINGNSVASNGGGVYVASGIFSMSGGIISGNNVGGGVYVKDGAFTISGGTISGNSAFYGGGVRVAGGTFTMSGGTVSGNSASGDGGGGGVRVDGGSFTMGGGAIYGNSAASRYGGGVRVASGSFTMNGGAINGNSASGGGGVYVDKGSIFTMNGGTVSGNSADGDGGGVYVKDGTFTLGDGAISGNKADSYGGGGGVYLSGGTFTMSSGAISGNTAVSIGGGVYVKDGGFMMSGGTISSNKADSGGGGGVSVGDGTFTMSGGAISGNRADENGGAVYVWDGTFTMGGGAISGNRADENGGAVYVNSGTFTMSGGTVHGRGAKTGLANTAKSGASLSIKDIACIAKYGNYSDIIESGLATDATLIGKEE